MKIKTTLISAAALTLAVTSLQAKSFKRGVSENQFQYKAQLEALAPGVTWYYNWGNTTGRYIANETYMEYIPMCWNGNYSADNIRNYVTGHPEVKYLLGFNEPNFTNQANMTPAAAAAAWPAVKALADELGLGLVAPALNYSPNPPYTNPSQWMDEFVALVGNDAFDYVAVHSYGGPGVMKTLATTFHEKYGKPVWVTEFCYWPEEGNANSTVAPETQISAMMEAVEWLEKTEWIYRYAWFKAVGESSASKGPNYGLLLSGKGEAERELSPQGKVYVYMSDFDKDVYHPVNTPVPAKDYISQYGCLLGAANNPASEAQIEITRFNAGAWVDYQFDVPQSGAYKVVLDVAGMGEPTRFDPTITIKSVSADGTATELCPARQFALSNSMTDYRQESFAVTLPAGKQTIRIADANQYSPSGIVISTVTLADESGIEGVEADTLSSTSPVNVYSMQGILIRADADPVAPLSDLPTGIYIVNGNKLIKQ